MKSEPAPTSGLWLHRWALLTAAVTFGMLALGGVVTSFRVGMADPVWPTLPWHLLLISWQEPSAGFLIEHTHRLAGHVVGLCVVVLAVWLWLREPRLDLRVAGIAAVLAMVGMLALCFGQLDRTNRAFTGEELELVAACLLTCLASVGALLIVAVRRREVGGWVRWLGTAALAGVIGQGLLGGFRVKLNALAGTDLAIVHGCFAQVIFALLVGLAAATAPGWVVAYAAPTPAARSLRRWSLLLVGIVLAQLVLGALVRHAHSPGWGRLHLLTAFAVVAVVSVLAVRFLDGKQRPAARTVAVLAALVVVELLLGVEAWMIQFGSGTLPELVPVTVSTALVRTAHVLAGAGILAAAVVLAVQARRRAPAAEPSDAPAGRLEGVA
jgi:cytochrome c oxidase assembly protein subunit 15